jgi:hypothetical protein
MSKSTTRLSERPVDAFDKASTSFPSKIEEKNVVSQIFDMFAEHSIIQRATVACRSLKILKKIKTPAIERHFLKIAPQKKIF